MAYEALMEFYESAKRAGMGHIVLREFQTSQEQLVVDSYLRALTRNAALKYGTGGVRVCSSLFTTCSPKSGQRVKSMTTVTVKSWAFPDVIEGIVELGGLGGFDPKDLAFHTKHIDVRTWEAIDELGRDFGMRGGKKQIADLRVLTPSIDDAVERIPVDARALIPADKLDRLVAATKSALELNQMSVGQVGYDFLADRSAIAKFVYAIGLEIRGETTEPDEILERQRLGQAFMMSLYGHGLDRLTAEQSERVAYYERVLGHRYCYQVVVGMARHDFDTSELTLAGLRKYGVANINGVWVCYWCSGVPGVCGGRKGGMKAVRPELTEHHVRHNGLPEMAYQMWCAYGGSRNTAISALTGPTRSMSEGGGELPFVELIQQAGGTVAQLERRVGPSLYLVGTRHDTKCREEIDDGDRSLREGLLFEAGDALVSWPCLVTQAFGLDSVRSVARGMQYMADRAEVELVLPEDQTRTVPVAA